MLTAVVDCDQPFVLDSDVIQASKQKLTDRQATASNGAGIHILSDQPDLASTATANACTNVASFSINTYDWDSNVNKLKAGGVTSIHLSSNRSEIKLKGQLSISVKVYPSKKKDISQLNCGQWDETTKSLVSDECTATNLNGEMGVLTCSSSHLTDFMSVINPSDEGGQTTDDAVVSDPLQTDLTILWILISISILGLFIFGFYRYYLHKKKKFV